eukprot:1478837-Amphidinium_carterae.3
MKFTCHLRLGHAISNHRLCIAIVQSTLQPSSVHAVVTAPESARLQVGTDTSIAASAVYTTWHLRRLLATVSYCTPQEKARKRHRPHGVSPLESPIASSQSAQLSNT